MTETTTTPAIPDEILAAAIAALQNANPAVMAAAKQAMEAQRLREKAEREEQARENQARFEGIGEEFDMFLAAAQEAGYEVETWYKSKDGQKTDQVSGVGYHVHGKRVVKVDGRLREANVTMFVKWSPKGGSLPADEGTNA